MSPSRDREDPRAHDARDVPDTVRLTPAPRRAVRPADPAAGARGIPEATVARLPLYLRALVGLAERGIRTCSSEELASAAGVNSSKLRKDLSYLGSYGTRGVGYDVEYLRYQIAREIGVTGDLPAGDPRHRQPRPRAGDLRRLLLPRLPHRGAARQRREPGRRRGRLAPGPRPRRARGDRGPAAGRHRRHRHPRAGGAGGLRPAGGRGRHQHPQLRPGRALGARRRRRPQGRPVDRAADPGLPRAAQGAGAPAGRRDRRPDDVHELPRRLATDRPAVGS